jgi:DNA invertase Pin-like site-specific DNA recombinase
MLEYLRKNPDCRVIVAEKTDRLYRNLADAAVIEALGVEMHLVKEHRVLKSVFALELGQAKQTTIG